MRSAVAEARSAGRSWAHIASLLAQNPDDPAAVISAFENVTATTFTGSIHWWCAACKKTITDHGPAAEHPADREVGHSPHCVRHAQECAVAPRPASQVKSTMVALDPAFDTLNYGCRSFRDFLAQFGHRVRTVGRSGNDITLALIDPAVEESTAAAQIPEGAPA